MKKNRIILIVMIIFLWLLSGCSAFKKQFPEKNLFGFDNFVNDVSNISCDVSRSILIKELAIAPAWDAVSFVYKIAEYQYRFDYYNEFMLPPAALITDRLKETLFKGNCFLEDQAPNPGRLQLEGKILSLYGDYQDKDHPVAVMEIRLTLFKQTDKSPMTLLNKTYSFRQPMETLNPLALAAAWNRSLANIIQEFYKDTQMLPF